MTVPTSLRRGSGVVDALASGTKNRLVVVLSITTMLTYAVIASGAVLASSGSRTCAEWPVCTGEGLLGGTGFLVVGHRLLTGVTGLLLCLTLVLAWRRRSSRAVRTAITAGGALYLGQVLLGALVALQAGGPLTELHLLVAGAVFAALLVALGWELEGTTTERSAGTGTGPEMDPDPRKTAAQNPNSGGVLARARGYLELMKPRLMWLLSLLALAGMALAATTGARPDGVTAVATIAGGVLAVGASGTFNHVAEHDRDSRMERTADRPVATDSIPRLNAFLFGVGLLALSMAVMLLLVNLLAAALTLVAVGYYSVVYTIVLKPNTTWNIAIGGGAGALPAVIGWAAVTGSIGLPALALAGVVVVWTPAHFYNLAIVYRDDYARGGYPMYPVVSGIPAARRRILLMLGATLLATTTLVTITPLSWLFVTATGLAGSVFFVTVVSQCRQRTDEATLRSFHASNAYLGIVLLAIVAEALLIVL